MRMRIGKEGKRNEEIPPWRKIRIFVLAKRKAMNDPSFDCLYQHCSSVCFEPAELKSSDARAESVQASSYSFLSQSARNDVIRARARYSIQRAILSFREQRMHSRRILSVGLGLCEDLVCVCVCGSVCVRRARAFL